MPHLSLILPVPSHSRRPREENPNRSAGTRVGLGGDPTLAHTARTRAGRTPFCPRVGPGPACGPRCASELTIAVRITAANPKSAESSSKNASSPATRSARPPDPLRRDGQRPRRRDAARRDWLAPRGGRLGGTLLPAARGLGTRHGAGCGTSCLGIWCFGSLALAVWVSGAVASGHWAAGRYGRAGAGHVTRWGPALRGDRRPAGVWLTGLVFVCSSCVRGAPAFLRAEMGGRQAHAHRLFRAVFRDQLWTCGVHRGGFRAQSRSNFL